MFKIYFRDLTNPIYLCHIFVNQGLFCAREIHLWAVAHSTLCIHTHVSPVLPPTPHRSLHFVCPCHTPITKCCFLSLLFCSFGRGHKAFLSCNPSTVCRFKYMPYLFHHCILSAWVPQGTEPWRTPSNSLFTQHYSSCPELCYWGALSVPDHSPMHLIGVSALPRCVAQALVQRGLTAPLVCRELWAKRWAGSTALQCINVAGD